MTNLVVVLEKYLADNIPSFKGPLSVTQVCTH
jgi:hypothetical protein